MTAAVRKFTFDTVFDTTGKVVRQDETFKRSFTREEVEAARAAGRKDGEASVLAKAEADVARELARLAAAAETIVATLDAEVARLKGEAVAVALAAADAIAGAAIAAAPAEGPAQIAAEAVATLQGSPKVTITVAPDRLDVLAERIGAAVAGTGFAGAVEVVADPAARAGDCRVTWAEGAVRFETARARELIAEAARRWLEAEGGDPAALALHEQLDLFTL